VIGSFLDWAVVLLPTGISLAGVWASVRTPPKQRHTHWKWGIVVAGLLCSGLTFWQQSRTRNAATLEQSAVRDQLQTLRKQVNDLSGDLHAARSALDKLADSVHVAPGQTPQQIADLVIERLPKPLPTQTVHGNVNAPVQQGSTNSPIVHGNSNTFSVNQSGGQTAQTIINASRPPEYRIVRNYPREENPPADIL
jgi:hypothetical protein